VDGLGRRVLVSMGYGSGKKVWARACSGLLQDDGRGLLGRLVFVFSYGLEAKSLIQGLQVDFPFSSREMWDIL
jgi:hypothetical protein